MRHRNPRDPDALCELGLGEAALDPHPPDSSAEPLPHRSSLTRAGRADVLSGLADSTASLRYPWVMAQRPRALITGITGQDGSYLAEFLLDKGYEVVGVVRRSSTVNFERIAHIQDRHHARARRPARRGLDDRRSSSEHRPTEVYNLAAQSFVMTSFSQPVLTGDVTALGVTRLLEAIRIVDPDIRFYQASSSEMFGKVPEVPQTETHAVLPALAVRRGEGSTGTGSR